ncbi:hypothetical protein D3C81_918480 [compost metagenome]
MTGPFASRTFSVGSSKRRPPSEAKYSSHTPGYQIPNSTRAERYVSNTTSGAPSPSTRPSGPNNTTRSTSPSAVNSSIRCSTIIKVRPSATLAIACQICSRPSGSSRAEGSSSSSTSGSPNRIEASANRCFIPWDSESIDTWSSGKSRPTSAKAASIRADISGCGMPRFSRAKASSSST